MVDRNNDRVRGEGPVPRTPQKTISRLPMGALGHPDARRHP
jgi:hypothetical protein